MKEEEEGHRGEGEREKKNGNRKAVKRDLIDKTKCNRWTLIGSWFTNKLLIKTFWR